jgi:adenylate cyclase
VDKFIGDGIMAVFGQPKPLPDDADRALNCALHLVRVLDEWTERRRRQARPALDAGIGVHVGTIVGGVLESGFTTS